MTMVCILCLFAHNLHFFHFNCYLLYSRLLVFCNLQSITHLVFQQGYFCAWIIQYLLRIDHGYFCVGQCGNFKITELGLNVKLRRSV